MKKSGIIYRHLLEALLSDRKSRFGVRDIAKTLGMSPNTVSLAIAPLKRSGAIQVYNRHFEVTNIDKVLAFWAVNRRIDRDVVYRTYAPSRGPEEIEKRMPDGVAYTGCSGYVALFKNDVSDYGNVYAYASEASIGEVQKRFPPNAVSKRVEGYNLFVLKPDRVLEGRIMAHSLKRSSVSMPQIYVDLWDSSEWYSYEFLKRMKKRLDDAYADAILE